MKTILSSRCNHASYLLFLVSFVLVSLQQEQEQKRFAFTESFVVVPTRKHHHTTTTDSIPRVQSQKKTQNANSRLYMSGYGIHPNYSWTEEAYEIELTVPVPNANNNNDDDDTTPTMITTDDVDFKATAKSIDLRIRHGNGETTVLLDGTRKMRGKISIDGTFWEFSDDSKHNYNDRRNITVTIEKNIDESVSNAVLEYDWKGIYPNDDKEVTERKYDEPEVLNVREYARTLGVDIDNINMSWVDKNMFSSGLQNISKPDLDALVQKGYVQEITKQADGKEFVVDQNNDGDNDDDSNGFQQPKPFSTFGDGIGQDEIREAEQAISSSTTNKAAATAAEKKTIPFLDTDSPWHKSNNNNKNDNNIDNNNTNKNSKAPTTTKTTTTQQKQPPINIAENQNEEDDKDEEEEEEETKAAARAPPSDPIDVLTVKRLKEILRAQGLKVSGNKKELQERLRNQVNSLLLEKKKQVENKQ